MAIQKVRAALGGVLFGQEGVVDTLLAAAASGGHVLLEGLPGLGKTLLARGFAAGEQGLAEPTRPY
jgi:MoxR-like ATPase